MFFCHLAFSSKLSFTKVFQEYHEGGGIHVDMSQVRPDVLSGPIWVQTVCKCYQQVADEEFSAAEDNFVISINSKTFVKQPLKNIQNKDLSDKL